MKKYPRTDLAALLERIKAEGPDAPISRAEATALIASRTMDSHDTLRCARNRVGMQLDRAIERGRAGCDVCSGGISPLPAGNFTADELGRWANIQYDNKFSDVPHKSRVSRAACVERVGVGATTTANALPGDVPRAHAMILQLLAEKQLAESNALRAIEARNRALGMRFAKKTK
jgi:hypothetical protein